jgi:very-short-patch-repair endonuclease
MSTVQELADELGLSVETIKTTLKRHKGQVVTSYERRTTNGGKQKCLVVDVDGFNSLRRSFRYEDMVYYLLKQLFEVKTIQRQYRIGSYRYDFRVDNLLIEYDEEHHRAHRQKLVDRTKELAAQKEGFKLLRISKSKELMKLHALIGEKQSKVNEQHDE